jgi:SAM-dependent methyltransferase
MRDNEHQKASLLRRFIDWNVDLSWKTTPRALWDARGFGIYPWVARSLLSEQNVETVVDVGGGRTWYFGEAWRDGRRAKLIGIDVSGDELALNPVLDQAVVADVCETLGVPDASVDLVLCRATVEHLHDTGAFLENIHAALKPGAKAALVFAGKWSPPIILNRILGHSIANKLLLALVPGTKGYGGFKAFYSLCSYGEFVAEAKKIGFEVEFEYSSYYSSAYFQFFFPLHFISILLDTIRQSFSFPVTASQYLFVLRKSS